MTSTTVQLCKIAAFACVFSILAPLFWWVLPCPADEWANLVVMTTAIAAAASWLALFLAVLAVFFEEMERKSYHKAAREYMKHNAEWFQKRAEMEARL